MSDIFISYKREEREFAEQIVKALGEKGWPVWIDAEILPGEQYRQVTLKRLQTCKATIVIWTPASIESGWVLDEAQRAQHRGVLIPLMMAPIEDYPLGFGQLHTHNLVGWNGKADHVLFKPVLTAVERLVGPPNSNAGGGDKKKTERDDRISGERAPLKRDELIFIAVASAIVAFVSWPFINIAIRSQTTFWGNDFNNLFNFLRLDSLFYAVPALTALGWAYDRWEARAAAQKPEMRRTLRMAIAGLFAAALLLGLAFAAKDDGTTAHFAVWAAATWGATLVARRYGPRLRALFAPD